MIPLNISLDIESHPINKEGEPWAFPGKLLDVTAVGALTKGTESGQPTITIRMDTPDGKIVLGQTTLRLFVNAARAFAAAYGKFLE